MFCILHVITSASGKEYEEFVCTVDEEKHVRYVRGRPAKIIPENGRMTLRVEDIKDTAEVRADMVVLAAALEPSVWNETDGGAIQTETDQYRLLSRLTANQPRHQTEFLSRGMKIYGEQRGAAAGSIRSS